MNQVYLSVIIPAFNEERRLIATLTAVESYLKAQTYTYQVIISDDGSTDQTITVAKQWCSNKSNFQILPSPSGNRGKGDAVRRGVLASVGELILFMDADNSVPLTELPKLIQWIDRSPVVIGSKYAEGAIYQGTSATRTALSRMSNWLIKILAVPAVADTQCGFKLFQKTAGQEIFRRLTIPRFGFDIELLVIARELKFNYQEVGVRWTTNADSRVHPILDALRTLGELIRIVWNRQRQLYR